MTFTKENLFRYLFSPRVSITILLLLATVYGIATFIDNSFGLSTARIIVYNNPITYILILLCAGSFLKMLLRKDLYKTGNYGMIIFHSAFLFIIIGAIITNLFGTEGHMHLREGRDTSMIFLSDNNSDYQKAPFTVTLNHFRIKTYPGSQTSSSYESHITINSNGTTKDEIISMNNIVNIGGYRLFQSSYDRDGRGSTLIVNYDPIGYKLSLVGYLLLFIGSVTIFISPNSRFNRLRKQIAKPIVVVLFLFGFSGNIFSAGLKREEIQKYTPEISLSQKFGDLNVQSFSGRNESISSYAGKILNKISNKNIYDDLLPEQALLGIIIYPEFWNNQPIIFSENKTIKSLTGESGDYHSFKSFFDKAGNYKLRASIDGIYEKDLTQRTKYDREILKVDEKLNIILSLQQWLLLPILPLKNDTNERWLTFRDNLSLFPEEDYTIIKEITSEYPEALIDLTNRRNTEKASLIIEQISLLQTKNASAGVIDKKKNQIERVYHRINIFARLYVPFMALGTVMIICSVSLLFRNRRWLSTICNIAFCITMLLYLLLTAGIAVRWYLSGHAPWSNIYESMVFVSWCMLLCGIIFYRGSKLTGALAILFTGLILLLCNINLMDPEITPLAPVLKSPWLMFHVAIIMISYALFGLGFLISTFSLLFARRKMNTELKENFFRLRMITEISLIAGVCFLSCGIFMGAIWANQSWGRYWGWDSKEVWALVTMLVYVFTIHSFMFKRLKGSLIFNMMNILAFSTVLMTYFGVNYFLSGLHSYGNHDESGVITIVFGSYGTVLLLVLIRQSILFSNKKDIGSGNPQS